MREEIKSMEVWQPEKEGDTLKGEVVSVNPEGIFGLELKVKKGDGEIVRTPGHKFLQTLLETVQKGDSIEIEYTGDKESKKGQDMKTYKVFRLT